MGRLFRLLIVLIVLAAIAFVGYAYLGPILGADFSAPQEEIRVPVTLQSGNDS
ncbi:hypothetical protein Q8W37_17460 [Shimia thalassica]|uniref:Uncharacterized protein n=1 Tax=Shimia thalassica TaxID=1715693 RepID=A0A0P1IA66_9RHOB|nr:hypothetical protein [Shimia thalassica]MBU2944020.1 hypothetical protein [Shimia thalassica]MDO6480323.1 hypothetical protein [Shimia thalassica]MDO6483384.1 hypothetical protein [Shimia thalassica]MDO6503533.1 hypothetical protein [Shimia thalassica]MDO6521060.1 hypothetical protein [Shimia thalassica]